MWLIPVSVGFSTLALCLVIYAVRKELIALLELRKKQTDALRDELVSIGILGIKTVNIFWGGDYSTQPEINVRRLEIKLNLLLNHFGLKYKLISIDKPELVKQESNVFDMEYVDKGGLNDTLVIKKQKNGKI